MRIESLCAVVVRNNHIVAVTTVPGTVAPRDNHDTIGGSTDRSVASGADINRVQSMDAMCDSAAEHGIIVVTRICRTATTLVRITNSGQGKRTRRGRHNNLTARDDDGRTDFKRICGIKAVKLRYIVRIGIIFFRKGLESIALGDTAF